MGMTRADATTYLGATLTQLLTDAGLASTDTSGALKEPIDDALLMTGVAYDDLATAVVTESIAGYREVLTYAALLRIADARGDRPSSVSIASPSVSKSWNRDGFAKRIESARLAALPYIVSGEWGFGTISFDYLEPVVPG